MTTKQPIFIDSKLVLERPWEIFPLIGELIADCEVGIFNTEEDFSDFHGRFTRLAGEVIEDKDLLSDIIDSVIFPRHRPSGVVFLTSKSTDVVIAPEDGIPLPSELKSTATVEKK